MKNIMMDGNVHECSSCGMCSAVCPTGAISIKLSEEGFYVPVVDNKKCIECGRCIQTCYKYDVDYHANPEKDNNIKCYSLKNKSKKELRSCSSGAVSIELMRACIDAGYKVVGVAYDNEEERAITKIASSKEELEQFKGSKYFQSYTEDAFRTIIKDRSSQKYAVFGTPCQIYAFSKYASNKKLEDRFLLVDIFCHGCPSFSLWEKYLEDKKRKCKVDRFDDIRFRSKSHGWHEFTFDFIKKNKKFISSKFNDPFYEIFFSNDILNHACYDCVSRSTVEKADIRLGDFWGARHDLDTEGVSAVALCSEKGVKLFEKVKHKFYFERVDFEEVILEQSYGTEYNVSDEQRSKALALINSELTLKNIVYKHKKLCPISGRIKNSIKKLLKCLPLKMYLEIKAYFHKRR